MYCNGRVCREYRRPTWCWREIDYNTIRSIVSRCHHLVVSQQIIISHHPSYNLDSSRRHRRNGGWGITSFINAVIFCSSINIFHKIMFSMQCIAFSHIFRSLVRQIHTVHKTTSVYPLVIPFFFPCENSRGFFNLT